MLLLCSTATFAHEDLYTRIKAKTAEISKDSTNPELYFERGFLYQQHFEFDKAISDFQRSADLGYGDKLLYYRTAEVYSGLSEYYNALASVNQYIQTDASDVKGQKLKAQILMQLNRYSEALEIYDSVITNTIDIRPEDFVEYSTIFLSIDSTDFSGSIHAIEMGLNRLGNQIISLRLAKIDYLVRSDQHEKVIEEYNMLIMENTRKEFWYFKKAIYLFDLGRLSETDIALHQARSSIEQLKPKIKNTAAIKDLIQQIDEIENIIKHEI